MFDGPNIHIIKMAWCNESLGRDEQAMVTMERIQTLRCPSCNHNMQLEDDQVFF